MQGYVPRILRDVRLQALHLPADADEFRSGLLQVEQGAIIVALPPTESRSISIDGHERHEDEVRLHRGRTPCRLHHAERPRLTRIARKEAEGLGRVGKSGKGND